jgi:ribose/xylose/arabinose/galactoside ABC-type transport system permease subunit
VIGGTSLFGGLGGLIGTLIGIIIPVTLLDRFVVLGLPSFWQQVAVGAVLIIAVYFDQIRRQLRSFQSCSIFLAAAIPGPLLTQHHPRVGDSSLS